MNIIGFIILLISSLYLLKAIRIKSRDELLTEGQGYTYGLYNKMPSKFKIDIGSLIVIIIFIGIGIYLILL